MFLLLLSIFACGPDQGSEASSCPEALPEDMAAVDFEMDLMGDAPKGAEDWWTGEGQSLMVWDCTDPSWWSDAESVKLVMVVEMDHDCPSDYAVVYSETAVCDSDQTLDWIWRSVSPR